MDCITLYLDCLPYYNRGFVVFKVSVGDHGYNTIFAISVMKISDAKSIIKRRFPMGYKLFKDVFQQNSD